MAGAASGLPQNKSESKKTVVDKIFMFCIIIAGQLEQRKYICSRILNILTGLSLFLYLIV